MQFILCDTVSLSMALKVKQYPVSSENDPLQVPLLEQHSSALRYLQVLCASNIKLRER